LTRNGRFADAWIGRRECLDHVVIVGEAHLRRVLKAYAAYYDETRTHLGIEKDAPDGRPIERCGVIAANAERNPAKWKPVRRKIARQSRNPEHDPIQSNRIVL
jgi:hypothetical protein